MLWDAGPRLLVLHRRAVQLRRRQAGADATEVHGALHGVQGERPRPDGARAADGTGGEEPEDATSAVAKPKHDALQRGRVTRRPLCGAAFGDGCGQPRTVRVLASSEQRKRSRRPVP